MTTIYRVICGKCGMVDWSKQYQDLETFMMEKLTQGWWTEENQLVCNECIDSWVSKKAMND